MQKTYVYPEFTYKISDEQKSGVLKRHPVVIIGAGPIGLTAALDCAQRGIPVVLIDDNNTVSIGSRAVCYAKRPLEIWDRLGVAQPMVDKGVSWQVGKVFLRDEKVYQFDLLPEPAHKMPAMINLQQYYLEEVLVKACEEHPLVDLRWKHKLISLQPGAPLADLPAALTLETPDGVFDMQADWVIACDGANSDTRRMVGAGFTGKFFHDRFLIADVVMKADFPTERWFWFDPPFHRGQSVLLHKQSDNVWRIDFQLGWDADPELEKQPERVILRIQAMLGADAKFELEWVSVYQFACRRVDNFRYGRVLFAGDAAHQVSPFGARGANTGVQDTDNLAWKLKLVLDGLAPASLMDSYHEERAFAADDNLLNSTRSTDFITPKNQASLRYRNAVLDLAKSESFARPLVNSGRLSTPTPYLHSSLNTPDDGTEFFAGKMCPGTNCADAPVRFNGENTWLLSVLNGIAGQYQTSASVFVLLSFGNSTSQEAHSKLKLLLPKGVDAPILQIGSETLIDVEQKLMERYDGQTGTVYLIRPDQHVAARWRSFDAEKIARAIKRCMGLIEASL
ncbi:MAG TPA: FAD-dependent oxidoreductase [Burkholderiaceae bacterium]|nr:FAD-dependent oxidoreductase [Burkholderiaceae bacterium]